MRAEIRRSAPIAAGREISGHFGDGAASEATSSLISASAAYRPCSRAASNCGPSADVVSCWRVAQKCLVNYRPRYSAIKSQHNRRRVMYASAASVNRRSRPAARNEAAGEKKASAICERKLNRARKRPCAAKPIHLWQCRQNRRRLILIYGAKRRSRSSEAAAEHERLTRRRRRAAEWRRAGI